MQDARSLPRTYAEIDQQAFYDNLKTLGARARPAQILVVLKANAYGHGALALAKVARAAGAAWLGVGDSTEALALRQDGDQGPLLILGALVPSEIPSVIANGITPVVHSQQRLLELAAEAKRQGVLVPVHLKIDTGMARLGMRPERLLSAYELIQAEPSLRFDGLMSHLATDATEPRRQRAQRLCFERALKRLWARGAKPPWIHLRNSAGSESDSMGFAGENLLRIGAHAYGFPPGRLPLSEDLKPVLSWHTQVAFLKDVPAGTRVGYEGTWTAPRRTRLAVIPVGYHDGLPRRYGTLGRVLIQGETAYVRGRVSMDYATIDVTDLPGVRTGTKVTLIGGEGSARITVQEMAAATDAIPHEIACGLGARVVRRYGPYEPYSEGVTMRPEGELPGAGS